MYDNVIVPFDGTQPGRTALAPAADLAWRCGARIVIVNNTDVQDNASRDALKSRAMSMSGADVDFWVDPHHELGEALVETAKFRSKSIICIAMKTKQGLRRKFSLPTMAEQVFRGTEVPVMVVGPNTDTSRGLPMLEIVASLDGSVASEQILRLAVQWAKTLKLKLILVGVVASSSKGPHTGEEDYLRAHAAAAKSQVPETECELIVASDPVTGLCDFMDGHEDALLCMSTHGKSPGKSLLGSVALGVIGRSKRCVVLAKPML